MAKETAEEAHRRIIGNSKEVEPSSPKEEIYLGQNLEDDEEEGKSPEENPETSEASSGEEFSESRAISVDAKAQSLADLRKAKELAESQTKAAQQENETLRQQYEERLASYDLRETQDFKKSFVEPIQNNSQKIATLFKTYTGKDVSENETYNFLNLNYQEAVRAVKQHGIDRSDKFMELWEDTQLIKQDMDSALSEAPERLKKARLADSEAADSEKRLQAQRHQKSVSEVQSSIKTNVVGFIELADDPEYNAGVSRRMKEFESATAEPLSKNTSLLIAKGVVYDDLVSEVLSLREQLKSSSSSKKNVEDADRISNVRRYSSIKEEKRESAREAHARIMGR